MTRLRALTRSALTLIANTALVSVCVAVVFVPETRPWFGAVIAGCAIFVAGWLARGWSDRQEIQAERDRRDSAVDAATSMAAAAQSARVLPTLPSRKARRADL